MAWIFDNDRPIYTQLLEQIEKRIISGEYPAGSRLPSVRELAMEASVNPNTMQRAMVELERSGLVVTNRTSGRTVTEDMETLKHLKDTKAIDYTKDYLGKMRELGYEDKQIVEWIKKGE